MIWHFINSGFNDGKYNMDFDIDLVENCRSNEVFFRLYKWKPYCISLGANQNINELNIFKADEDQIDIVKRPTGGRAILHAEEITYSVIYPARGNISPKDLYNKINCALKEGLLKFDFKLNNIQLEETQTDFRYFYKNKLSNICFASSAKSELKYSGKKLVGSAQKKFRNSILQHGSILCGGFHKRIADYLNLEEAEYKAVKSEIESRTTDLKSILCREIDYDRLAESLASGFAKYFNVQFVKEEADAISV